MPSEPDSSDPVSEHVHRNFYCRIYVGIHAGARLLMLRHSERRFLTVYSSRRWWIQLITEQALTISGHPCYRTATSDLNFSTPAIMHLPAHNQLTGPLYHPLMPPCNTTMRNSQRRPGSCAGLSSQSKTLHRGRCLLRPMILGRSRDLSSQ